MTDPLAPLLDEARARWLTGGVAPAPAHPLTEGADPAEADLRLAAVEGQRLLFRSAPAAPALRRAPDLPAPSLPPVEGAAALALLARLAAAAKTAPERRDLFALCAARGRAVPPLVLLPEMGDADLPAACLPLQRWQAMAETGAPAVLTEADWDIPAAPRRAILRAMRGEDPGAVTALLTARLPGCGAAERLALLDLLIPGLSEADVALLETLGADRSEKVRARAAQLLGRLGRLAPWAPTEDDRAFAAEAVLERRTGLLRRRTLSLVRPTDARGAFRPFDALSFRGFCAAAGIEPERMLADYAPGVPDGLDPLGAMLLEGGTAAEAEAHAARHPASPEALRLIETRCGPRARIAAATRRLGQLSQGEHSAEILRLCDVGPGRAFSAAFRAGPSARFLRLCVQIEARPETPDAPREERMARLRARSAFGPALRDAALILTAADAASLLATLEAEGLPSHDPRADLLRLAAALPEAPETMPTPKDNAR